ncbi:MAG: SRPBCC family protein [Isosphaeraceae bacterium]
MSAKRGRSYEKTFEVMAPAEAVWRAITDGEELTRWFCKEATCDEGVGGHHRIDWGGGAIGTGIITVWEPGVHLRTEAVRPDLGQPTMSEPPEPYAIDWYLEHEGGVTRVRMVASGFGEGPDWDHEYDGTFYGWDLFHKTMKHYLENHRGQPVGNVVLYAVLGITPAEAWVRLMSADGLVKEGSLDEIAVGTPFRFVTGQGDVLQGDVRNYVPGRTFAAMVESLNKAILNIEMSTVPGRGHFLYLSLMTWGLPKAEVDALGARFKAIIDGLFPQPTESPMAACAVAESEPAPAQPG